MVAYIIDGFYEVRFCHNRERTLECVEHVEPLPSCIPIFVTKSLVAKLWLNRNSGSLALAWCPARNDTRWEPSAHIAGNWKRDICQALQERGLSRRLIANNNKLIESAIRRCRRLPTLPPAVQYPDQPHSFVAYQLHRKGADCARSGKHPG